MYTLTTGGVSQHWALLPLRLVVGYGFFAHGMAKWSRGPAAFAKLLASIGVPVLESPHGL